MINRNLQIVKSFGDDGGFCQEPSLLGIMVKLSAKENYITSSLGLLTMMDPGIGLIHNSRIYHFTS